MAIVCEKQNFAIERKGKKVTLVLGTSKFTVPEENVWQLGIPVAGLVAVAATTGQQSFPTHS